VNKLEQNITEAYRRGYIQGCCAGYEDGKEGRTGIVMDSEDVAELPIVAMGLSTRAYHCLHRFGCRFVSDVVRLRGEQIGTCICGENAEW
jgi:hypothetical protein